MLPLCCLTNPPRLSSCFADPFYITEHGPVSAAIIAAAAAAESSRDSFTSLTHKSTDLKIHNSFNAI
jgi:hypothetical protein